MANADLCDTLASDSNSHTYNSSSCNQSKMKLTVDVTVTSQIGIEYSGPAYLDTGSSYNIMPLNNIPTHQRHLLNPTSHIIYGISAKPVRAVGTFRCTVRFRTGFLQHILFVVLDSQIPVLLGLQCLQHPTVKSFGVSDSELILTRKFSRDGPVVEQCVPLCLRAVVVPSPTSPRKKSLQEKVRWIRDNLNVLLPEGHHDPYELKQVADDSKCN